MHRAGQAAARQFVAFDMQVLAEQAGSVVSSVLFGALCGAGVLPFGRAGIISAAMLGLGRALGETMAVAMVLSPNPQVIFQLLTSQNSNTIAANIALNFPEAHGVGVNILLATGLVLFVITLVVNSIARVVINRRKAFSGAN